MSGGKYHNRANSYARAQAAAAQRAAAKRASEAKAAAKPVPAETDAAPAKQPVEESPRPNPYTRLMEKLDRDRAASAGNSRNEGEGK